MARVRTVPDRREAATPKEGSSRSSEDKKSTDSKEEHSPEKKQSKSHHHDELKYLHDSLSTFFTPATGGRRHAAPKKFDDEEEQFKQESSEENDVQEMKPLTIDTSSPSGAEKQDSKLSSSKSPAVSPARRACEKLMDSLSPYFSATSEKRTHRRPSRVEHFIFPGETSQTGTANSGEDSAGATAGGSPKKMKSRKGEDLKKVVGCRRTQNSASAALFGSPVDDATRTSSDTDATPSKRSKNTGKLKIKKEPEDDGYPEASPPPPAAMKEKKKKKTSEAFPLSPSSSNSCEKENFDTLIAANGEITVSDKNLKRFEEAQRHSQAVIDGAIKEFATNGDPEKEPHWPVSIRIGNKEIKTWYSAPFPQEYASTPVLHICEFCLHYMKSEMALSHHRRKCEYRHPPGNEIYRNGKVSVFEVDGNTSRIYCQNLCLIAKLFLDHKTLYYDVEPFLFYVVTTNDEHGFHIVGYFSKEKYSNQKWNLSCIVTLPCYQKMGFGRFLIDFSFLLSRKEGLLGTPERPLSNLGRISYASYWRTALFEWLHDNMPRLKRFSLQDIATGTGISTHDIVEVLDALQWFQKGSDGVELNINWTLIDSHYKKARADKARIWLDESCLRWVPVKHSPSKDFRMRSPVRLATPHRSPTTANVGSTPTGVSIAAVGSTIKKGMSLPKSSKKKAARRKLALVNRKEPPPSTSESASSDEEPSPRAAHCKDPARRRFQKDSSPDDSGMDKKPKKKIDNNGLIGRQTNNSASTSVTFSRRISSRGKGIYEEEDNTSSSLPSEDDEKDESFSIGKGNKGKKPQKGKNPPVVRRRRPAVKKPGKSPGKVFPPDYGKIEPAPRTSSPGQRCDSAASSATIPMRFGDPSTPGGGREVRDLDDGYRQAHTSPCGQAPSTSLLPLHSSRHSRRSSSISTTPARSPAHHHLSDSSLSRPHSPLSRISRSSTPLAGRHEQHQMIMNMGGIPDDDSNSRCGAMSVESDQPPQLHAVGGTSSDEAPPHLPAERHDEPPPLLTAGEGYTTDDDEAPPQLSPVLADDIENEPDPDKPPRAPLTEEQRHLAAMDQPPKAPIKQMDEENLNSFDTSVQSIMEPSSSASLMAQNTPQNTYPGSLKQNTPGSVPSCGQMQNQTTPEMQQAFMSPMQIMQPGSVSSVHGVPPNGTIDQGWVPPAAPQSDPSTPLRSVHSTGPFGSPPGAVQLPATVQPMRASVDAPIPARRSGEGSRSKRNQQQQQLQQQQQQAQQLQQQQFAAHQQQFGMQMNPLNQMYMQPQYPAAYPGTSGYGFDPTTGYPPATPFWPNYPTPYGKANGSSGMAPGDEGRVFLGNMMQPAMMYPNYQNGMNGMMQNAYRGVYSNPTGFNTAPNQFPPTFPYPNQFFPYKQ